MYKINLTFEVKLFFHITHVTDVYTVLAATSLQVQSVRGYSAKPPVYLWGPPGYSGSGDRD